MTDKKPTELIPLEYVAQYQHRAVDEYVKDKNIELGRNLCARCGGTGNEFYSMYRMCSLCDGTGEETCQ